MTDNDKKNAPSASSAPEGEGRDDGLDTETTFADMNVEGFSWYDPNRKTGEGSPRLSREELRAAVLGAFRAFLPLFIGIAVIGGALFALTYLWLGA